MKEQLVTVTKSLALGEDSARQHKERSELLTRQCEEQFRECLMTKEQNKEQMALLSDVN